MSEECRPTVLLVDDNPRNIQVLAEIMENNGYETAFAMSGKQVLEYLTIDTPDIILLDVMMPELDGYEVCKLLKRDSSLKDIPIIFLTAKSDTEDIIRGFEAGGVDYVSKPFNAAELRIRIKTHLDLKKSKDDLIRTNFELREANEMVNLKNLQLREVMQKLDLASKTDELTGLYNRRYIIEKIEEEQRRFNRNSSPFSIMISDIDFFKKINDTYGHDYGDFILMSLADILKSSLREQDSVARWGGEEFLFILADTNSEGAAVLAERLRKTIQEKEFIFNRTKLSITMTFGISQFIADQGIDFTIKKADDALYKGKVNGRNCVVTY